MIPRFCATTLQRMRDRFATLYGDDTAAVCVDRLVATIGRYGVGMNGVRPATPFDASDIVLITYADMLRAPDLAPLSVLHDFLKQRTAGAINSVHLLPFYPWSSDDGFSVIDYRAVNPSAGTWKNVAAFSNDFHLMFDLVLNHVSRQSQWFQDYINGIAPARHYFIEADPNQDLSTVVRPRTSPLLTAMHTKTGQRHVWTTFSDDQIDLNFANPDVLFEFFDILMLYLSNGARILRLDAIAYLWKTIGTECIHQHQTHTLVKLLRDLLDMIAPDTRLLTETNVPHQENVGYFGDGDEAHMVYQFSLPPLLVHAVHTCNAETLTRWAACLPELSDNCTYLNFTASHDGIGVRPLQGLISDKELQRLADAITARGGHVSFKRNADGSDSPYELNITYLDAVSDPDGNDRGRDRQRFLTTQAVMLAMQGVPAVYFHSLFGTRNDYAGVEQSGIARRINRRKFQEKALTAKLADSHSEEHAIFTAYHRMLRIRATQPAFSPSAAQDVFQVHPACFALRRRCSATGAGHTLISLSNFSDRKLSLKAEGDLACLSEHPRWYDLLSETSWESSVKKLSLPPWQTRWLIADHDRE